LVQRSDELSGLRRFGDDLIHADGAVPVLISRHCVGRQRYDRQLHSSAQHSTAHHITQQNTTQPKV
jgi:hypothetical protein